MRLRQLSVVVSVVLVMAGCTPPSAPVPPVSPTPESTSAPAVEPLTAPVPALPLTCEELYSVAELTPIMPAEVSVLRDEASLPRDVQDAAWLQGGGTECLIGGAEVDSYNRPDARLGLHVLPHGLDVYEREVARSSGQRDVGVGDRSDFDCVQLQDVSICMVASMIGDWALLAHMAVPAMSAAEVEQVSIPLFQTIATRIAGAGSEEPQWTPPSSADPAPFCDTSAAAAAAFGVHASDVSAAGGDAWAPGLDASGCRWTNSESRRLVIEGLVGGAWAWDAVAASTDKAFTRWQVAAQEVSIAGADGALLALHDNAYLLLDWRGTLLYIEVDEPDGPSAVAAVEAMLATVP